MRNTHGTKFLLLAAIGLLFMSAGILAIVYGCLGDHQQKDWTFWGIISCIAINTGILFIISATVHKVKAELLKKQKSSRRRNEVSERDN